MDWTGIQCNGYYWVPVHGALPSRAKRERAPVVFTTIRATRLINHPEVKTMPKCAACGAELAPPVRVPHTVYVKTLYRVVGQDYCRHHVIRAAVAAGLITEVRPGAGPVATMNLGAPPMEHDRPFPV